MGWFGLGRARLARVTHLVWSYFVEICQHFLHFVILHVQVLHLAQPLNAVPRVGKTEAAHHHHALHPAHLGQPTPVVEPGHAQGGTWHPGGLVSGSTIR